MFFARRTLCSICLEETDEELPPDPEAHIWADPVYTWDDEEGTCNAIHACTLNEKHRAFLHIRRNAEKHSSGKGRPWVAYTQAHYNDWYYERFGSEICVSEDTLKVWQARIVDKTVRFAIYYGCFAV